MINLGFHLVNWANGSIVSDKIWFPSFLSPYRERFYFLKGLSDPFKDTEHTSSEDLDFKGWSGRCFTAHPSSFSSSKADGKFRLFMCWLLKKRCMVKKKDKYLFVMLVNALTMIQWWPMTWWRSWCGSEVVALVSSLLLVCGGCEWDSSPLGKDVKTGLGMGNRNRECFSMLDLFLFQTIYCFFS